MAITAAPFALKNLGLDAEPLRQAVASLVPNSGGVVQAGDLNVTQTSTPSLGVLVGVGRAWMPGTNTSNLSGQTYSTQGQYFAVNDAPFPVNLTTANATNPRIDLIYIGTVDTFYGGASNIVKIDKVIGTPAATPLVPTLPANSIALARVAVAANATSVTNANITQVAGPADRRYMEFYSTAPFNISGGSVSWDVGPLSVDTARTYPSSVFANTTGALSGAINITESGVYSITSLTVGPSSPGNAWISIRLDGSEALTTGNTNGYAWETCTSCTTFIAAGSYIRFVAYYTTAVNSSNTRVRLTKISA